MVGLLNEKIGARGYTMVARAPGSGIPCLSDGAWHVVGGTDPTNPDDHHAFEERFIPFILGAGGDIVLYRLPTESGQSAKPVVSRGGMEGRPPMLNAVKPYDPAFLRDIAGAIGLGPRPAAEPPPTATPPRSRSLRPDLKVAALVAAGFAALVGGASYATFGGGTGPVAGRWNPDLDDPAFKAMRKGAVQIVMPRKGDPDILEVVRIYPPVDGKDVRDKVDSFQAKHFEQYGGTVPPSPVRWRNLD